MVWHMSVRNHFKLKQPTQPLLTWPVLCVFPIRLRFFNEVHGCSERRRLFAVAPVEIFAGAYSSLYVGASGTSLLSIPLLDPFAW